MDKLKQGDRVEIVPERWEKHLTHGEWRRALPARGIIVEVRTSPTGTFTTYQVRVDGDAPVPFGFGAPRLRLLTAVEVLAELAGA